MRHTARREGNCDKAYVWVFCKWPWVLRFTSLHTAVTQGRRIGGMSHRAACGWSHVHVDSGPVRSCGPVYGRYRFIGRVLGHLERKFLKYSFSWYDSFIGTKVLGTFAPEERKFHRSESSKERMFHGTKVPRERKFSLWSFRSRERKCTGTKRPGIHNIIIMILIIKEKIAESQLQWQLRQFYVPRPGRAAF